MFDADRSLGALYHQRVEEEGRRELRGLRASQNEMEVGTGRALSAVILVTLTATPGETARERKRERESAAVVRIPVCADVNEPRSCYIPVCHRRGSRFSFIYVPPSIF